MLGDYSEIKDPHKTTMSNKPENHIYTASEIRKITDKAINDQAGMAKQIVEIAIPIITKECLLQAKKGKNKCQFTIGQFSELSEFDVSRKELMADIIDQIEKMMNKLGYGASWNFASDSLHIHW
jgi:hypothetical protein